VFTTAPRQSLQLVLEAICENVYFQPPSNVQMNYPAIVYERNPAATSHADNKPFRITPQYQLTLVTQDPDDAIWAKLAELPTCVHDRFFVADNLNHDVFTVYF
jgi:hypothetical protein